MHLLIIGTVFPEPASSAAGSRMMQLIDLFKSHSWNITFGSAATDSEFMVDLSALGLDKVTIELNNGSFNAFIKGLQPDIVLFDRFMIEEQFGWRVAEACPDAMRILDTEDLHCLRAARQLAFKQKRTFEISDLLQEEVAKREIASILRCDLSLIISPFEMMLLNDLFKIDPALLHYIPFMLDKITGEETIGWPAFTSGTGFVSIGNFLHEPNWNAVLFLKEEIWPLIRKQLPEAGLYVYGAYASQKVNELHNPAQGFYIMGRAASAKEVITKAKVLLAPLRFGAGIKGKLTDAMECGTPSVTTSIGAEGMHSDLEWSGMIADNAAQFAAAAVQLYTHRESWEQAQINGIHIINTIYPKEELGTKLMQRVADLKNNLKQHRLQNFTGAMLMHHTISGTKYMSKWIEAKNKNADKC